MSANNDFYEDDEPVQKIIEAFEHGTKELTGPPRGRTKYLDLHLSDTPNLVGAGASFQGGSTIS